MHVAKATTAAGLYTRAKYSPIGVLVTKLAAKVAETWNKTSIMLIYSQKLNRMFF